MFQSVYDYPYLSSSANHIFDMTWGFLSGNAEVTSAGEGSTVVNAIATQHDKKRNMYAQMAQILNGFDINGKHLPFDFDGNFNSYVGVSIVGNGIIIYLIFYIVLK